MSGGLSEFSAGQNLTAALLNRLVNPSVYKAADEQITSSTTLQNDDELFCTVKASAVYVLQLSATIQSPGAGGFKMIFTAPTGATINNGSFLHKPSAVDFITANAMGSVTGINTSGSNQPIWFTGVLIMSTTAGTLNWQWAQNASSGTATIVRAGSYLSLVRVA